MGHSSRHTGSARLADDQPCPTTGTKSERPSTKARTVKRQCGSFHTPPFVDCATFELPGTLIGLSRAPSGNKSTISVRSVFSGPDLAYTAYTSRRGSHPVKFAAMLLAPRRSVPPSRIVSPCTVLLHEYALHHHMSRSPSAFFSSKTSILLHQELQYVLEHEAHSCASSRRATGTLADRGLIPAREAQALHDAGSS